MAVSTSFAGAKLEALFLKSSSSRASPSSQLPSIFGKPIRSRKSLIQRGAVVPLRPVRCEVAASDVSIQTDKLSALEQLKASAADSNASHLSLYNVF